MPKPGRPGHSEKHLHAALALLDGTIAELPYLKDRLFHADAQGISVIRQSLAGHKDTLVAECWRVLENPGPEDQGKPSRRPPLALYDPKNPRWEKVRIDVANRLVAENAYVVARWIDALRPVAKQLSDASDRRVPRREAGESERTLAASALAEYLSDQPDELAELLMAASEKPFAALYPGVERRSESDRSALEVELAKKPPPVKGNNPPTWRYQAWEKFYQRQANATVALIRMGRMEKSWPLLKHSPDPSSAKLSGPSAWTSGS